MDIIAYYEGSDAVKDWLGKIIEENITFKKLPKKNYSKEFAELPAYVADILYLDSPDIILSGNVGGIHEKPIFSIEFAACTPHYEHSLQRFGRMMASSSNGCPSAIIIPEQKREDKGGKTKYQRSHALAYGAVKLMDIYRIPAFLFDWLDEDGMLQYEENMVLPKIDSPGVKSFQKLLRKAIAAFGDSDYLGNLWKLSDTRHLLEATRVEAYSKGYPTIIRPGGGSGGRTQANLELLITEELLSQISRKFRGSSALVKQTPSFIVNREKSLVFYPTRLIKHAGDPYVGMIGYYDIAFTRVGPSTRDRMHNLIAYAKGVSISEITKSMKEFHSSRSPFSRKVSAGNIVFYSYHLKCGCKATKIKPIRIYGELADMIIFDDGLLFNVG